MSVVVLTYGTHDQGYYKCLVESCRRYGYALKTLGWGVEWRGYGQKLKAVLAEMRQMQPDQLVMFVDAFDVFMCRPAAQLEQAYKDMGEPTLLVGANRSLPYSETFHSLRFGDNGNVDKRCQTPYKFLCSGTYLCRAKDGVRLLASLGDVDDRDDDQSALLALRTRFGTETVQMDCNFRIFATLMRGFTDGIEAHDKISVVEQTDGTRVVHSGVTDTMPFVVHGPADTNLQSLAKQLGFDSADAVSPTPMMYNLGKTVYHLYEFLKAVWVFAAIVVVLLLAIVILIVMLLASHNRQANMQERIVQRDAEKLSKKTI